MFHIIDGGDRVTLSRGEFILKRFNHRFSVFDRFYRVIETNRGD